MRLWGGQGNTARVGTALAYPRGAPVARADLVVGAAVGLGCEWSGWVQLVGPLVDLAQPCIAVPRAVAPRELAGAGWVGSFSAVPLHEGTLREILDLWSGSSSGRHSQSNIEIGREKVLTTGARCGMIVYSGEGKQGTRVEEVRCDEPRTGERDLQ